MPHKPPSVLAVNPGSRYLGIAVMQGTLLRDWRVKVLKGKSTTQKRKKATRILMAHLLRYRPTALAIKSLNHARSSKRLNLLTDDLSSTAERHGLQVCRYSLIRMQFFFAPSRRINKAELAEIIAAQYPDLSYELLREKTAKNPYHIRLFEAVALAALCAHQLDNR